MLLLPWLAFFIYSASAVLVNVTIDDTFGDPTTGNKIQYSPPSSWNLGGDCNGCSAYPSAAQAYLHTWQDGTFDSGSNPNPNQVLLATVPFTGTAVYVYCILALSQASPTGRSDMTFIVDNQVVGTFVNEPQPGQSGFLYNVLVYANNSLADSRHILTIQNGHTDGEKSLILLDYIIYSHENSNATNASGSTSASTPSTIPQNLANTSKTAQVVGAVLGTLIALLLIAVAIVAYRRHKNGSPILPVFGADNSRNAPAGSQKESSFKPQLLVQRFVNMVTLSNKGPPQMPPKHNRAYPPSFPGPRHYSSQQPYLIDPPVSSDPRSGASPAPLLSARNTAAVSPIPASSSPHSARMESIKAWSRRTLEETRGLTPKPSSRPPTMDMSEELSSYYDDAHTESRRVKTPPPPPRRFTVMNN